MVTNATELLRRALDALVEEAQYHNDIMLRWHDVFLDIRAFLDAEPEASALQRYKDCCKEGEPETPIERLRFFCSFAMKGQDWLDVEQFFDGLAAETEAEPVYQVTSGIRDWADVSEEYFRLFGKGHTERRVLYRHLKTAEPEAEPIGYADRHELEEFRSGNYGNFSVQCKEKCEDAVAVFIEPAARKPMTREEIIAGVTHDTSDDFHAGYWAGVRFAEKHHGIGGDDVRETPGD